ncbi:HTH-type transcriptional regulator MtrR [Pseudoprimorskyibacter insulae]|uniref:HTH-type transcriptional regulator MtrR n=2 Tax=Pseudoprimorskyibacter insulae TaxID=1695997 RepID=A0A2R8AX20_9RHOB|nr:HTH-type transcriptional regulator MtrR [Pseudoprimorskyibacter insulae]
MADIAQAAGMSRPALYLHFKNKEDIFRSLVSEYYADSEIALDAALASAGPVENVLKSAFAAMHGPTIQPLLESPHGAELLDTTATLHGDIARDGDAALTLRLTQWLAEAEGRHEIALSLPAAETAKVIMAALKGVKEPPFAQYVANRDRLATLFAKALRP